MASEEPEQIYYPSARLRLNVRFEEYEAKNTPEPPAKPPQLRAGKGEPQLDIKEVDGILQLVPFSGTDKIGPTATHSTSSDDRTWAIEGIVPVTASLTRNPVTVADTLELQVAWDDLPFDPRVVRATGVELYLGTVTPDEFRRGIEGELRPGNIRMNIVPDAFQDSRGRMRSNLRFQGWVDEWDAGAEDEDSGPTVKISCTDYTRVFLDQAAPPKLTIGADVPIDRAIAEYLANFPQFVGVGIAYVPNNVDRPMLKDVLAKSAFTPTLGPSPQGNDKLKVWDYVTDVAGAVGHIVHVRTTILPDGTPVPTIVVQRPRTLMAAKFSGRHGDPFRGRILPSGRELLSRTFIVGKNVRGFSFKRKYTAAAPQNIEVRCFSTKAKRTLIARYPVEKNKRDKKLSPGDQSDQKWEVKRVSGIDDEATLRAIAQGVYEMQGRGEVIGTLSTKNLASFGGGNPDPDMLDVIAGDNIELEIGIDPSSPNTVVAIETLTQTRAAEYLMRKGFSRELAEAYGKAKANIHFPSTFRVNEITYDWDSQEEGVSISMETMNYANALRDETSLPQGEELEPDPNPDDTPERVEVI